MTYLLLLKRMSFSESTCEVIFEIKNELNKQVSDVCELVILHGARIKTMTQKLSFVDEVCAQKRRISAGTMWFRVSVICVKRNT